MHEEQASKKRDRMPPPANLPIFQLEEPAAFVSELFGLGRPRSLTWWLRSLAWKGLFLHRAI